MKIFIFFVLALSLTLSGCGGSGGSDGDSLTVGKRFLPEGGTLTIAFEDLPIGAGNDYDYNDFVTDVSVFGTYSQENLAQLEFTFEAQARGSELTHDLHLLIPAGAFGSDGTYTIELYEADGTLLSSTSGVFSGNADLDLVIFDDTWGALPPNPDQNSAGNTVDGSGVQPGRVTKVFFDFTTPFAIDSGDYSPEDVGVHGEGLLFDPYLSVWNAGGDIHITDERLVVVPIDWEWPEEEAAIWTVYPYNSTSYEGVDAGSSPSFTTYWYTETPTEKKWTP
jgi:LruC domain-containing protein